MPAVVRAVRETVSGLPRTFWWLWTSTLINRLGAFVVTFLALYLTLDRGYSATYAGLVASLYGLGGAVGAVVGGVLTDRVGRRSTMLLAQLGAAAGTAALAYVNGQVAIASVATVLGVASSASRPAVQAMMADMVPAKDRVRAFSLNYWAINIGFGVSSAAAGLIASQGYFWLFLGGAVMTLLCALVIWAKVPETMPESGPASAAAGRTSRAGLGIVLRDRRFMAFVALTFLLGTVTQQGSTTLSVDMGRQGFSASQYGLVIGLNGLLIVLLQIPLTRMVEGRSRAALLTAGTVLMGWGFGLTAFAGSVAFYAFTVAVWTIGEILHAPASMSLVADLSPAHARGRYQGMYSIAWPAASFAGPLLGGVALDRWGGGVAWGACAVVGTVAGAGYWLLLRERTLRAEPVVAAPPALDRVPGPTADH
ncbi:MFS transporter [Streptomyces sp. MI02-7b]|uniref:MDR family MFS transporter n=1 Tax=Streptomyces sp. MI02-7b TaxID=462941 RepID=UPI0029B6A085|nr:MFS transporter [Streptomyces sp. MI02-7b]MDX3076519.1 MFS transporter [Streptomyces sp. MI02-7b]